MSGQLAGQIRPYIRENIEIYYVSNPNTIQPGFSHIPVVKLFADITTTLLFGETTNNSMDKGAILVDELFKGRETDPSKSITKSAIPDNRFQETVFHVLQLSGKKIKIFFINDNEGLNDQYLKNFNLYYKKNIFNKMYVWPSSFRESSREYAGAIVLGQHELKNRSREYNKQLLISLIAQIGLNDFGPARDLGVYKMPLDEEGNVPVNFLFPASDTRRIENQGIAGAFLLHYSKKLRNEYIEWTEDTSVFLLPGKESDIGMQSSEEGTLVSPQRYSLRDKFIRVNDNNGGMVVYKSNLSGKRNSTYDWAWYKSTVFSIDDQHPVAFYYFQNDFYLGGFFYQLIRAFGIREFVRAIDSDKGKIFLAKPGTKTAQLIQNMCMEKLGGKTVQYFRENPTSPEAKNAIFPLAIFSLLGKLNFASSDQSSFKKSLQFITGAAALPVNKEFDELVDFYISSWQKKIYVALQSSDPSDYDDDYIYSKTARIARLLGIN